MKIQVSLKVILDPSLMLCGFVANVYLFSKCVKFFLNISESSGQLKREIHHATFLDFYY
jgi:hypothetical protein